MKISKRICRILLIAAFWMAIWWLAAYLAAKPLLFPSPHAVLKRLLELMQTKEFYLVAANSLFNILSGILIAVIGGCVLAVLTSRISLLREAILPVMTVIKATPVASFIILALIWIGSARVPSFITVLIVLPLIWTNLDTGFSKIDSQLTELCKVYRMPMRKRYRFLVLPSLKPYFISACRASLGLAWKAGIAAEIIAMPRNTIGTMIGNAKQYILTEDVYAWTLTVVIFSLIIELVFTALFNRFDKTPDAKEV